jgi:hypothetical protein
MNKDKKNIVKHLFVISLFVLLLIIVIISSLLSEASKSREKAFRSEATKIVNAAKKAVEKINKDVFVFGEGNTSCRYNQLFCFTIEDLVKMDLYDGDFKQYIGKIEVDAVDPFNIKYNLFFKKNNEFKIIRGIHKDYIDKGIMSIEPWKEEYSTCTCLEETD